MTEPQPQRRQGALLGRSQERLAEAADVSAPTVVNFETGVSKPQTNHLKAIQRALEEAGIEFIRSNGGGPGVRLSQPE